ncbi:MAG: tRNA/rRNA methyltransferase [Candidatus Shapirobacteria bacterium GW2011_GWE1_38_10]|uniref:tRNA/rRNA methyltransferase n=1 Tax=Candidatus Shapirobacteria bacterium GW2011_GWE1_38_10 TaxID=1618488 RepID=A0A0G0IHI2_9BACT|nr:MAG: tRNA/rRNA methyltransferase [Candidatus Shapirobacteria bacterium GW2011_GWF2_37_20]KKQ50475.1 MAG: tRNA/rRNA methyltransferase [Candidatus Shapirobacteria bacterium GW2011_GWE1_38_10]KKQ65132.1 MAG: tRNA/rRNA methyltransferase [Candidatus Shapirobacteria bacterium GW2011_GWF1_38_23]HBP50922.1 RNA methyltransferase [Candidatus Shapirobacteria bacterium]
MKLNSHQLRKSGVGDSAKLQKEIKRNPIVLVLDNVLDTYNIGSFFRLADALGASKIYLCGPVVTPPNLKIHRASIGTWKWIPWEHFNRVRDCLNKLKTEGYQIVACEQGKNSINYQKTKYKFPLAIVAGSEMNGITENSLKMCDQIVEIPMYGINVSLNVLVATAIIAFDALGKLKS